MTHVVSVRRITLDEPVPVYDATNNENHNYALGNGVVVHNTAKQARYKDFQEILPLKGKILNSMRAVSDKVFESEEVKNILTAIGFDPSKKDPLSSLRIGRFVVLADADVDGRHIETLVLTLLVRYLPGMFERGMVYTVDTPVYMASTNKGRKLYGDTVDEVNGKLEKGEKVKGKVTYLKGLGEMNPDALREVAFDPRHRKLVRITGPSRSQLKEFTKLMADDVDYRRELLGLPAVSKE